MDPRLWSDFSDATFDFGKRKPGLFQELKELCSGFEEEVQITPVPMRTRAYTEMDKVVQRVDSIERSQDTPLTRFRLPSPPRIESSPPSVRSFSPSQILGIPPSPPPPPQERSESQATRDSSHLSYQTIHSGSEDSLGRVSQPQLPPGGAVAPPLSEPGDPGTGFPSLLVWMQRHEEGYFEGGTQPARRPQGPRINTTRQNQNAAAGLTRLSDPLEVAPKDTPPAGSMTHRQNSILSQILFPPSPTTAEGPAPYPPRPPSPSPLSQTRTESLIPKTDGDDQRPSVQFATRVSGSPDPKPQPTHSPVSPDGDGSESSTGLLNGVLSKQS